MSKIKKVYIYYLNLPDDLRTEFPKKEVDAFYEVKDFLLRLTKHYNEECDRWYYLYAFTTDKECAKIFEDTHNMKIFTRKVIKFDKEDYADFKRENITTKLQMYNYDQYDRNAKLLCTKDEIMSMDEDFGLIIDSDIMNCVKIPYEIFKPEYIRALDLILYCLYNKLNEDDMDIEDFYSTQWSYGVTPENSSKNQLSSRLDNLSLYIKYFGILLKK